MAVFYDTHAHLDYPDYAKDLSEVIERAQAAGITKIISIGTDLESSRRAIKLAERFIAGVTKPDRQTTPEDDANPHRYEGPARTAEQVAA